MTKKSPCRGMDLSVFTTVLHHTPLASRKGSTCIVDVWKWIGIRSHFCFMKIRDWLLLLDAIVTCHIVTCHIVTWHCLAFNTVSWICNLMRYSKYFKGRWPLELWIHKKLFISVHSATSYDRYWHSAWLNRHAVFVVAAWQLYRYITHRYSIVS